jgi:hypothetical protein
MINVYVDYTPAGLKDVGVSSNSDDMVMGLSFVCSAEGYPHVLDALSSIINSFFYKAIVCVDDDYYVNNVSNKIKDFRGALGKFGLLDLKKVSEHFNRFVSFEKSKYYIDVVRCSKDIPTGLIDKILSCLFDERQLFMCLSNRKITWPTANNAVLELRDFFINSSLFCDCLRIFAGVTLKSERFIFFIGEEKVLLTLEQKVKLNASCVMVSGFDDIFNTHTHIYPNRQSLPF